MFLFPGGVKVDLDGKTETVKVFVSCIAADMPAKAGMLNMKYHHGFYGCGSCENPGFSAKKIMAGITRTHRGVKRFVAARASEC